MRPLPTETGRRPAPRLLSVNVGMPKDVPWQGRTVHTGIWKQSVDGPLMVRRLNVDGDGQGDLAGHGGEQRAVLVYQLDSYGHWAEQFGRDDFEYGQFGENFTVDGLGLSDDEVCIGDRYRIGEAEFEVSQPRVTCFRVGIRMGELQLPALLVAHHRPGFYLRVIEEGQVQAGDEIVKTRSGRESLSVADTSATLYLPDRDLDKVRAALRIPALSPGWQQSFREMVEAAEHDDGGEPVPAGEQPAWPGFRRMRVADLVSESPTVTSIYLASEDGSRLPEPKAGQYLTIRVADADLPTAVRSYSLSSDPGAELYRLSVKREPHGVVSGRLHTTLRPGATLDVAAPRGEFTLEEDAGPVLLISGGIGATPVLAMLHQLASAGTQRPVWWIHTTHDAASHVFAREAHALLATLPDPHEYVFYTASRSDSGDGSGGDGDAAGAPGRGEAASAPGGVGAAPAPHVIAGRPSAEKLRELHVPAGACAYVCGPVAFMDHLRDALIELGVAEDRIHTELFSALPAIEPGVTDHRDVPPHQPAGAPGTGPLVTFARSGLAVRWDAQRRSLLELADACDVPTRWSCRTGVCHTCRTHALAGDVAYSPDPLDPPEAGDVLICCSQPSTDVVLDL